MKINIDLILPNNIEFERINNYPLNFEVLPINTLNEFAQKDGLKLGLSRGQVSTYNFGYHTIDAIKDLLKRTKELSVNQAFEMVAGKSYQEVKQFLSLYMKNTQKSHKPITEMNLIRVIVNNGRGCGHQRAAITLMNKLCEAGFSGEFDVWCVANSVLDRVKQMVGQSFKLNISVLPDSFENLKIFKQQADLAVCAADDFLLLSKQKLLPKKYNALSYIGLQPTDWYMGGRFTVDQDGIVTELPSARKLRLSSNAASQILKLNTIKISKIEKKVLEVVKHYNINSQLVYGLYPHKIKGRLTGNLDELTEIKLIVGANLALSEKIGKPAILLMPQKIASCVDWIQDALTKNVYYLDLTKDGFNAGAYKPGDVVLAYTDFFQHSVFDYLMLQGTTLPPVIEGCNSMEICNMFARPFIHGSSSPSNFKEYNVSLLNEQKLHKAASYCLEMGALKFLPELIQYMYESVTHNNKLLCYHEERQIQYFKRPDACEEALDVLNIRYTNKANNKVFSYVNEICAKVKKVACENYEATQVGASPIVSKQESATWTQIIEQRNFQNKDFNINRSL